MPVIQSSSVLVSSIGTKVNLFGSNPKEIALIDQWIHFAEQEIGMPSYNYLGTIFGQFSREVGIETETRGDDLTERSVCGRPLTST